MRLSASRLPLAAQCLYFARPDVILPEQDTSAAAELGTALHAVAEGQDYEKVAERGGFKVDDLAALVDEWRSWWPLYSEGRRWDKEAPYAFDVATGKARLLPNRGHRDYSSCTATEVPATIDAATLDGVPTVLDLKSGRAAKTLAAYRKQVELGALCVARTHGLSRVRLAIAHVTERGVFVDETNEATDLDELDLEAIAEEVRAMVAAAPTAQPRPGAHCSPLFCPARAVCPTTLALVAAAPAPRGLALTGDVDSDEDAETLLNGIPKLKEWIKEREAAVRRRALTNGGITLSDGRRYLAVLKETESVRIDVPGAMRVLREQLGEHAEIALTTKSSKEAIKRAARVAAAGQRGGIARIERETVEALRKVGAVNVSERTSFEYREPALPATGTDRRTTET